MKHLFLQSFSLIFDALFAYKPSHHHSTKPTWRWLMHNDLAGTGKEDYKPNDFWESVYCLLTPKP